MAHQISLRLDDELLAEIDRQARRRRWSRSDMIREILEQHVRHSATSDHPYSRVQDLIGNVTGGPRDLGARHRSYLIDRVRDRRG